MRELDDAALSEMAEAASGPERLPAALAAQAVAQTALTVVSVLCGLLLVVFVEPPTPAWTGGEVLSSDRRPAILAAVLLAAFVAILTIPPMRDSLELSPLAPAD